MFFAALGQSAAWAQTKPTGGPEAAGSSTDGPIRLRQAGSGAVQTVPLPEAKSNSPAPRPSEFESFSGLSRFGSDLVNDLSTGAGDFSPLVPGDYVVQIGDEIHLTIWGAVDADLQLLVDRSGRVALPRVGPVLVAGLRYADLERTFTHRVAQVFKSFELSVSLGRMRGVRVYVTGFVQRPGAYAVAGLSTAINAVMRAGGPAASGSFRQIELRRAGRLVGIVDLYDLFLKGSRGGDQLVQPDDVIHVPPVGPQVALKGSVNNQAVFELRPGEVLRDVLLMSGGFSPVADRTRLSLERVDERNAQAIVQLQLPAAEDASLSDGDVLRAFSAVNSTLSVERQNKRVRVEGEVAKPGEYLFPAKSTLSDALRAAGGTTSAAHLYGTVFTRESVRLTQQESLDRAMRELETEVVRNTTTQRVANSEEALVAAQRVNANERLFERLRSFKPSGRVVFQVARDATALPDFVLENGDRLLVPPKPSTVGVFGSVFNSGNYLFSEGRLIGDYLQLAGGPTKGADESSLFVVRANGEVASSRQQGQSWLARGNQIGGLVAGAGDLIFLPEELDKTTFVQVAKDWTQIIYQFGIGIAGFRTLSR